MTGARREGPAMARKSVSGILLAVSAVLALAACNSVPKAAPGYAAHDFGLPDGPPARQLPFPIRNTEVVPAPWLASTAMHYRLLYAQPTRRQVFVENRWAAQPAQLIELTIRRSMRTADPALGGSGCRLRIDLDEFAQVFDAEGVSRGVVEARAALLAPRSDRLIATRAFSVARPAPTANAVGGVVALREAVTRLKGELLDWLEGLDADPASRVRARCGA